MRKGAVGGAALLVLLAGCVRAVPYEGDEPRLQGPPEVQLDVVHRHARQFDVEVPDRRAGSQQELAAGSYILGHLQLAGYAPRLDRVPVGDAVNSTNVVAFPPGGGEPEFVVTVPYDSPRSGDHSYGTEIGIFLEVARALMVADPEHRVGFVALGAESADHRGTRRLARFLLDEGVGPSVISLSGVRSGPRAEDGVVVWGACQEGHAIESSALSRRCEEPVDNDDVITAAGFEHTWIGGDPEPLARELFGFLTAARS
ncbi:MAG TPA: hypothetical protein VG929_01550 [Actinomycetota bacterium]|nr:hypothetical protein [Actinomycetota bacterium]